MTITPNPSVLIVEDQTDLADLYETWLSELYPVKTAYQGEEALEELDDDTDVVLLDRRMPGISGDKVLELIRDHGYECRVVMVTAVEPDFDIIDMGFDDYLVKPISRDDIIETINRLGKRNAYNDKLDTYASLVSKKIALEEKKSDDELTQSDEFEVLKERMEELRTEVDPMVREFDNDDVAAVLRDIPEVTEV